MSLLITLLAVVILLLLGTPLVISLAGGVALFILLDDGWMMQYPQQVTAGMGSFILLAMPLFIFAGVVMNASGIAERIFAFARSLVSFLPGGVGQVNVVSSLFFGGMVGTSVADLAASGSTIIPQMKKARYPGSFSAAVSASSSNIGPLIPPSSPMILYAAVTGASVSALFVAGIIPGVILTVLLMILVGWKAHRNGWDQRSAFRIREVLQTFVRALPGFGVPLIIIVGLWLGIFTPTESGAFASVYAIIVGMLAYRTLKLSGLYKSLVTTAILTGEVMLIVGVSVAFGATLTMAGLPGMLTSMAEFLVPGDSQIGYLIVLSLIAIVAGLIFDPLIPVIMPLLLPTVLSVGIDPIHFGVIIVLTVVIGQITPPVGMSLVVAAKIAKVDPWLVLKANTPFLVTTIVVLGLVIMIPELATWLPGLIND